MSLKRWFFSVVTEQDRSFWQPDFCRHLINSEPWTACDRSSGGCVRTNRWKQTSWQLLLRVLPHRFGCWLQKSLSQTSGPLSCEVQLHSAPHPCRAPVPGAGSLLITRAHSAGSHTLRAQRAGLDRYKMGNKEATETGWIWRVTAESHLCGWCLDSHPGQQNQPRWREEAGSRG